MSIQLVPRSKYIPSRLYSQSVNAVQGNKVYLICTQNTYMKCMNVEFLNANLVLHKVTTGL